ncbi:MAG: undecaprenyl/decaprenyl-phosphate alpha-N-acetylglucosaminyl 1-phosphate transferase [Chlamydiae bacterium]|nr:undecaprenyl/decaprenyl-phosphate alpha-N-acetylglucosaminyl 1-phosphate transferase [Chlamydiota bacterium]MBI3266807.1 undecaprenyl/decaprenyl-phosphate alpha-N-acetylglucosaminyl 1-phosphate transferase [Chlamydiota bacterium]
MKTYLMAFIISFFSSLLLVPLMRRVAFRFHAFGREESSSIPRLGGVAVYLAFILPLVGLVFYDNLVSQLFLEKTKLHLGLFVGGTLVLALGMWDDIQGLSPLIKLCFELIIGVLTFLFGFRIDAITTPLGESFALGFMSLPVTLAWIVGVMNAVNLIDGIDGLASGVSLFSLITLGTISYINGISLNILLCCALGGAVLGFLKYNFNPATIYLGDAGSLFLGYTLAILSLWGSQKAFTLVSFLTPLIAFGIPIIDMLVSVGRRYFRGMSIFQRDTEHIHHRLKSLGFSKKKVVLILYAFCIFLNAVALFLYVSRNASVVLVVLVVSFILGLKYLGYLNGTIFRDRWKEFERIRKERFCKHTLVQLRGQHGKTDLADKLWHLTKGFSKELGFGFARMELGESGGTKQPVISQEWCSETLPKGSPMAKVTIPLVSDSEVFGSIELAKPVLTENDKHVFAGAESFLKEVADVIQEHMKGDVNRTGRDVNAKSENEPALYGV